MSTRSRLLLGFVILGSALALAEPGKKTPREVIDLGSLQVEGAARGPEIQYIDSQKLNENAAGKLLLRQLEKLEGTLLAPESADLAKGKGGRK